MPKKYVKAQLFVPLGPEFDADRLILITLSMIVMGVVGLFIWDGVFPDRRDVRILGVLPVPVRTFVVARLAALGRVFVLFATPLVPAAVSGVRPDGHRLRRADWPPSRHLGTLPDGAADLRVRVLRADRGAMPAAGDVRPARRPGRLDDLPGAVRRRPGAAALLPAGAQSCAAHRRDDSRRDRGAGGLSTDVVLRGLRTTGRTRRPWIQRRSPASRRD